MGHDELLLGTAIASAVLTTRHGVDDWNPKG